MSYLSEYSFYSGISHSTTEIITQTLFILGMLAAFPKLVSDADPSSRTRQHTYVETDSVRYVYQPIEDLYLIVITTKGSNIIQDLDTLRLISKVLPDYCQPISEQTICEHVFELVFAFDEVISLGYREDVTMQEIRRNLEMESHEEKLHDMLRQSKEDDAKQEMRRKAASIKAAQRDSKDLGGIEGRPSVVGVTGFGSESYNFNKESSDSYPERKEAFSYGSSTYGGYGKTDAAEDRTAASKDLKKSGMKLGKGMSLKKKKKAEDVMDTLANEEGIDRSLLEKQKAGGAASGGRTGGITVAPVKREPVELESIETISLTLLSDGSVSNYEVKGTLAVTCQPSHSKIQLILGEEHRSADAGFKVTTSPKLSKPDYQNNGVLKLRQAGSTERSFPDTKFSLVSWKMKTTDEDQLPLKVIFWPEEAGSGRTGTKFNVSVELTLSDRLQNEKGISDLLVKIPLGRLGMSGGQSADNHLEVVNLENGMYRYNSRENQLEWEITLMNQGNASGMLEFEVEVESAEDFFPVHVQFHSAQTMFPLSVDRVEDTGTQEPVAYGMLKRIDVESFRVLGES